MPYRNFHSARQIDPALFRKKAMGNNATFKTINITNGITAIIGKLDKGNDKTTIQALRFDRKKYSPQKAIEWLEDHGKRIDNFDAADAETIYLEIKK